MAQPLAWRSCKIGSKYLHWNLIWGWSIDIYDCCEVSQICRIFIRKGDILEGVSALGFFALVYLLFCGI